MNTKNVNMKYYKYAIALRIFNLHTYLARVICDQEGG